MPHKLRSSCRSCCGRRVTAARPLLHHKHACLQGCPAHIVRRAQHLTTASACVSKCDADLLIAGSLCWAGGCDTWGASGGGWHINSRVLVAGCGGGLDPTVAAAYHLASRMWWALHAQHWHALGGWLGRQEVLLWLVSVAQATVEAPVAVLREEVSHAQRVPLCVQPVTSPVAVSLRLWRLRVQPVTSPVA
eukprot:354228-Chlamydomonas_euryale.AAC.1